MNRRIPNGTYGGVRGRGLVTPSYSIARTTSRAENVADSRSLSEGDGIEHIMTVA